MNNTHDEERTNNPIPITISASEDEQKSGASTTETATKGVDAEFKNVEGDEYTTIPLEEEPLTVREAFFGALSRGNKWKKILPLIGTLIMDVALPVALYFILKAYVAPVWALLIAGAPALLAVVLKGAIKRQLDIIGLLVFCAFGISAVVAIASGDPRILVFEKSMVTAVLGVIFLISLAPIKIRPRDRCCTPCRKGFVLKPFLFYVVRQMVPLGKLCTEEKTVVQPKRRDKYDWLFENIPTFKRLMFNLTIFWGIGFFIEFVGRLAMVLSPLSLDQVVLYANIFFAVVMVALIVSSGIYAVYALKQTDRDIEEWLSQNERHMMLGEEDNLILMQG